MNNSKSGTLRSGYNAVTHFNIGENNYRERYIITPTDEYSFNQLDTGEIPSNFFKVDLDNTEFYIYSNQE